jgi:hypothetical protein
MDPKVKALLDKCNATDDAAFEQAFESNEQAMQAMFDKFPGKANKSEQDKAIGALMDGLGIDPKANRKEALKQEMEDKKNGGHGPFVFNGVILPGARVNRGGMGRTPRRRRRQPKPIKRLSEYTEEGLAKLAKKDPFVLRIDKDARKYFGWYRGGIVELDSRGRPCRNPG